MDKNKNKQSKDKNISKVYILASYEREGSDFQIIEASENFEDINIFLKRNGLICSLSDQATPVTKELLDSHGQILLDYNEDLDSDNGEFDLEYYPVIAVALDMEIPENREAIVLCGNGDDWCWEGSIKGLYPSVEEAWKALATDNYLNLDEEFGLESDDEEKRNFFDYGFFTDNNFIYWSWLKISIKGQIGRK